MKKSVAFLTTTLGTIAGAVATGIVKQKTIDEKSKKVDKFKTYYNILNEWLVIRQSGRTLEKYFLDNGYHTIAIYGMGEMGNRLYEELKGTQIKVAYAIDKEATSTFSEVEVRDIEDELTEVDAIVVSAVFAFEDVEEKLQEIVDYPIISLEDVVFES